MGRSPQCDVIHWLHHDPAGLLAFSNGYIMDDACYMETLELDNINYFMVYKHSVEYNYWLEWRATAQTITLRKFDKTQRISNAEISLLRIVSTISKVQLFFPMPKISIIITILFFCVYQDYCYFNHGKLLIHCYNSSNMHFNHRFYYW